MPLEDISFSSHIHAPRGNQLRLTRSACLNKIRPIYPTIYLFTQSRRPEKAILDSYDKCESGFSYLS